MKLRVFHAELMRVDGAIDIDVKRDTPIVLHECARALLHGLIRVINKPARITIAV